ncbi:MAG: hypothetical protein U5L95_00100 [Candidatus Saccharibacteria bacterium]|nr:hypothetical protein [Candidatus Saccharibacteria bacterium]
MSTRRLLYSDFDGGSPENTNHLSDRTRYVVAGEGVMTISGVEIAFTEGDEVIRAQRRFLGW